MKFQQNLNSSFIHHISIKKFKVGKKGKKSSVDCLNLYLNKLHSSQNRKYRLISGLQRALLGIVCKIVKMGVISAAFLKKTQKLTLKRFLFTISHLVRWVKSVARVCRDTIIRRWVLKNKRKKVTFTWQISIIWQQSLSKICSILCLRLKSKTILLRTTDDGLVPQIVLLFKVFLIFF